jgi:hypothetical protein
MPIARRRVAPRRAARRSTPHGNVTVAAPKVASITAIINARIAHA